MDSTACDDPSVSVRVDGGALQRAALNARFQPLRRALAAVHLGRSGVAHLRHLRGINAEQADALARDVQRVAVHHKRGPSECGLRRQRQNYPGQVRPLWP